MQHGSPPRLFIPDRIVPLAERQAGSVAIEFAFAFPVFFALLYGILMYGFIFLTQMGLQHAAEDGAREALRYAPAPELSTRIANAKAAALAQINWLPDSDELQIDVGICKVASAICAGEFKDPDCTLANAYTTRCQVVVTITYSYEEAPLVPPLPGFGLFIPSALQGSARVLLDGRALSAL